MKAMVSNFWVKSILLPILLIVPVVWFAIPAIPHGTDNIRIIAHFDKDEATLAVFAEKIYSRGLVPMDGATFSYPQLFYYLGGIILFPYTLLKGIDDQTITIVLRCLNTMSVLLTVIFAYFFVLRFFKSIFAAVLSGMLLATMPEYLWWAVNSRPHPLELLFILIAIYFCFKIVEKYELKLLVGAILFSSLAASTKYGGFFLIPIIWLSCLFDIFKLRMSDLINYLKEKSKTIYFIASLIIFSIVSAYLLFGFLFFRLKGLFIKHSINNLGDIIQIKEIRLILAFSLVLLLFGVGWWIINVISNKLSQDVVEAKHHYLFVLNKGFLVFCGIVAAIIFLFLILNPTYWLFSADTAKTTLLQIVQTTMGSTGLDSVKNRPIFDAESLVWFGRLFDNRILNVFWGILLLFYVLYELLFFKQNWHLNKNSVFQRILLWVYAVSVFLFLFLFVLHKAHHYLLPVGIVSSLLIPFGMVEVVKKIKLISIKILLIVFFCTMVIAGFYMRVNMIIEMRDTKLGKNDRVDAGLLLGRYLENKYTADRVICIDDIATYIPAKFQHVIALDLSDKNMFNKAMKTKPDVCVLSFVAARKQLMALSNKGIMPHYKVVKLVDGKGGLNALTVLVRKR